ncbi:MAG TPA: Spy/CpxP family protein refolding chaperone [Acetobacteraceae bacterium]
MSLKTSVRLTLLATVLVPGLAFAQSTPPAGSTPPAAVPPAASAPPPAAAAGNPAAPSAKRRSHAPDTAARVEQRIKQLHSELGITPAEETQWTQFAQVMRDNATAMDQKLNDRGMQLANMNAAQDMQSYADLSAQHAQDMQKLASAFQTLYASMPDEQKQTADEVFRGRAMRARHGAAAAHHPAPASGSAG